MDSTPEAIKTPRTPKPKFTFMLHEPGTYKNLGTYKSPDPRYSALKAATRGVKDILLRKTNTKIIYKYKGDYITLDTPTVVKRGTREIKYSKKPVVKFEKKFVYEGALNFDDDAPEEEVNKELNKEKTPATA